MVYDIIVIAILIIALIVGYHRGAAKMIVSLCGFFLSFLLSAYLGDLLSELIYNNYLSNAIISSISTSVSQNTNTAFTNASLPPFVSFAMLVTGFDYEGLLTSVTQDLPQSVATGFETAIQPLVMSVLSFVLTGIIFIILYFIFRHILLKALVFVFNLPVIRLVDKFIGVVLSLVCGLLVISFSAFLLHMIMPYITHMPYYLSESTIYNSYIFYHFYSGNIFNTLMSVF